MKKKEYILAVLFFSSLWGISEAVLGGILYRANVSHASVPLSIIGFAVITLAWVYFPRVGTGTGVAACAMLYKFFNAPFFGCHLLGILTMGVCYDLFFGIVKTKSRWLAAAGAAYLSYAVFAVMITYLFRYEPWIQGGLGKVLGHIGIAGSMAALGSALLVPLSFRTGEKLKSRDARPFALRLQWSSGIISAVTLALWALGATTFFLSPPLPG
ncbi:MAG: hypothetical protein JW720_04975 [Sedimentisphaerales bacterium]|nr:hypothetical protein [Sedimentisphaerales bacterium]